MKLPNGGMAVVEIAKLRDYCLTRIIQKVATRRGFSEQPWELGAKTRKHCGAHCLRQPVIWMRNLVKPANMEIVMC
jgi:hypothetical protein